MRHHFPILFICVLLLTGCVQNVSNIGDSAAGMISSFADMVPQSLAPGPPSPATLYEFPEDGFAISLPSEWEVLDLETFDVAGLIGEVVEQNELLGAQLSAQSLRQMVAAGIRLYALNTSTASLTSDSPASINILIEELPLDLTLAEYTTLSVAQIARAFDIEPQSIEQDEIELGDSAAGILRYNATLTDLFGDELLLTNKQYFLVDGRRAIVITLSISTEMAESYLGPYSAAVETFRLLP